MKRWTITGIPDKSWKAVVENQYLRVEAEADSLFEAMNKAEKELTRKTEQLLRNLSNSNTWEG